MLQATQLRLAGNALAASGDLAGAVSCYSQGLGLEAPRARSALLAARSAALLKQQKARGLSQWVAEQMRKSVSVGSGSSIAQVHDYRVLQQAALIDWLGQQ